MSINTKKLKKMESTESCLVSSILGTTLYQLLIHEKFSLGNIEKDFSFPCEKFEKTKRDVNWLKEICRDIKKEISNNNRSYSALMNVIQKHDHKEKCTEVKPASSEKPASSKRIEHLKPVISQPNTTETSLRVKQPMEETSKISHLLDLDNFKVLAVEYVKAMENSNVEVEENFFKLMDAMTTLSYDVDDMRVKNQVEEEIFKTQKDFLQKELQLRTVETEKWYERFYTEREELYENLVRLRLEIQNLKDGFLVMQDDFLRKRELLNAHYERAKEREIRLETETPFRIVQSWWRATMVRLKMGKYEKYAIRKEIIDRRKKEEAMFSNKLKQKYGTPAKK